MNKSFRLSLIFCTLALLLCGSPTEGMYKDLTREDYLNEMMEYLDEHNVLIEEDDRTQFDSIEAIRREMERREKNWEQLMGQEWGTITTHTVAFFGDVNLVSPFSAAQAIVLTPFRAGLGFLAQGRKKSGENQLEEVWEYWKGMVAKEKAMNRFYLKFIVRLYDYYGSAYASLKYGNKVLKPVFSKKRESGVHYEREVRYEDGFGGEREEWKQLELESPARWPEQANELVPFSYFDFLIDDPDFDPQGLIELSISKRKDDADEEAVFVIDLSRMR